MIGCDVQITPLDDEERALLARYAARKAGPARTYATAQLGQGSMQRLHSAPDHGQCEVCGAPLRYAETGGSKPRRC